MMGRPRQGVDVQLPHLETFAQAAELCSFTAAAKALYLTQASVSQRVQSLEKSLGTALFHRHGGKVTLTEAGRRLYDYAERILDLHTKARTEISGRQVPITGELFLAASSIPGDYLMPAWLPIFAHKYPDIRVHATVSDSMDVIGQVEQGRASIGLVGRECDNPHLEFRYLARDRMVLVVPRGHRWCKRRSVSVRLLAGQPLLLREVGSGLRHCFEESLKPTGLSLADLHVVLELGSNEAIKEAVDRGVGLAVLSIHAARKDIETGRLSALDFTDVRCERDMFVVLDRRRVLPLSARLFLTFLETYTAASRDP